ncbi:MAG: CYTH domain-containing protein [Oscillospiraceae bacterium]|nr:CYTH domain-containing protein [Oscillospiraceae bacterium]
MEIERKFLVESIPSLEGVSCKEIIQGYLCTKPVVRVRKEGDEYILTYKGKGHMAREEYNLPLTEESYAHLVEKCDGHLIRKTRYYIPLEDGLVAELDIFKAPHDGLVVVEVEFETTRQAEAFAPPSWFGMDVTYDKKYKNARLSKA